MYALIHKKDFVDYQHCLIAMGTPVRLYLLWDDAVVAQKELGEEYDVVSVDELGII